MKSISLLIGLILIMGIFSLANVLAKVSIGVKKGDWIEYNVNYTGTPIESYPKFAHPFPEWIRIDITNVQGTTITADWKVETRCGLSYTDNGAFNLETGFLDLLVIPAGLEVGDEFYHEDFGNNTITETEDYTYAGARRTVIGSTISNVVLRWDKSTGILLQSDQSEDIFTQNLLVKKTNMWQPQILGLDSMIFYVLMVAVIAVVALVVLFLYRRRK